MTGTNWVVRGAFGRVSQLEMTASLTTHSHPQLQLMVKVGGADGVIDADGEDLALTGLQAVLLDGWEPHGYQHSGKGEATRLLMCHFEADWVARLLGMRRPLVHERQLMLDDRLVAAVQVLLRHGPASAAGDAGVLTEALEALVLDLGTSLRAQANADADPADLETRAADRRLVNVLRYMREHMDDRTTMDEVASRFGLSRPHLHEMFRQRLGLPPHVCWNGMRMEHALRQLGQHSATPIKELAFDLGFSSQGNFTRFFQSIQGLSPSDYQAAARREAA